LVAVLYAVSALTRYGTESVPLDWGWAGFIFIIANGFLLSCIILNKKSGLLDRLLLTVGLGFGLTFVVMILMGVLWQLTLPYVLAAETGLLVVLGILAVKRGLKIPHYSLAPDVKIKKHHLFQAVLISIIVVLAFSAIYDALSLPPTEWDSLAYGVNYAKIIYQNSHIPLIAGPSIGIEMSASYPPGMQLSATFLYVFAGSANDFYYRMLSPIFSLATLLVVYKFARQLTQNRTAAVFAASALTLIPYFWQLMIQDTYLMSLTFMLSMSGYLFYKAYNAKTGESLNFEILGILFCGFAALTSYIGLLAFGVPIIYAVHKRVGLKKIVGLFGLGALVVLPWYLRNLVMLGNPFYPFLGGKYLDPLLHSSTSQSFQQYLQLPEFALTSTLCKIAAVLLVVGIVFFTFYKKRRDFPLTLTLYFLLVGITLMAVYVAFPRYIIIALPTAAVFFGFAINTVPEHSRSLQRVYATSMELIHRLIVKLPPLSFFFRLTINTLPKKHHCRSIVSGAFIAFVILTSAIMLPYVNSVKPSASQGDDRAVYISNFFYEGNAWNWINDHNTPENTKIATFDIKEYYLNRTIFSLDGKEAAPLYYMNNITDASTFLTDHGVGYILSAPWASNRIDIRMPQAFNTSIITKYLGDSHYFPPVFVDGNGTAVYRVGAWSESESNQYFDLKGLVAPFKESNITVSFLDSPNDQNQYFGSRIIAIPVDYCTKKPTDYGALNITVSFSNKDNINSKYIVELWNEKIPADEMGHPIDINAPDYQPTGKLDLNYMIASSSIIDNSTSFSWHIDRAGYFTIRVLYTQESTPKPSDVPLDIRFVPSV
jgi:hypothetical protein